MPKYINFKFPLRKFDRGYFEGNQTTIKAITENIKILLLTTKGERVINPDIGTNLSTISGILFDNVDKSEIVPRVREEIIQALQKYMSQVKLTNLVIETYEDNPELEISQIKIKMSYVLEDIENIGDSISLTLG